MITNVPIRIMEAARAVTLRHPNSMEATLYRKVFTRTNETGEMMGGSPTLGGMGQLTNEDEDQFTYEEVGEVKILVVSKFDGDIDTTDREDATVPGEDMQEALIASVQSPGVPVMKYDLVAAMPGGGVVIAYEVLGLPSTTTIYPYTTKYIIAPRDDLHSLVPWAGD